MVELIDPTRDELLRELRLFRRGDGVPSVARMTQLFFLVEILGDGVPERAFQELEVIYRDHGLDPLTSIGAYFYLSGWGVGLGSVDQRRHQYVTSHYAADVSTPWRRSERGLKELVGLIRDRDEHRRPWAFVSIFQSGNVFQPVIDFNLGYESWQRPSVFLNGDEVPFDFVMHRNSVSEHRFNRRLVMEEAPLNLDVGFADRMAVIRVHWPMPVWPVWSVASWTADPRIMTQLRTFRQRAVEVSLQWWRREQASAIEPLVGDGAIWAERSDPKSMNLPTGWVVS